MTFPRVTTPVIALKTRRRSPSLSRKTPPQLTRPLAAAGAFEMGGKFFFILLWALSTLILVLASSSSSSVSGVDGSGNMATMTNMRMGGKVHSSAKPIMMTDAAMSMPAPEFDRGGDGGGGGMNEKMAGFSTRMSGASAAASWEPPLGSPPLPSGSNASPIILRDASIDAIVRHIAETQNSVEALATAVGGFVSSSSSSSDSWLLKRWADATGKPNDGSLTNAYISLRVPVASFESTRSAVRDLLKNSDGGSVASESSSARDVTAEYVDASSRAESATSALAAMKELFSVATNINEILAIQREMNSIVNTLESAEAQVKSLSALATMSSLSVSLRVAEPPQPTPSPPPTPATWSPLTTVNTAFASLGKAGAAVIDALIFMAIFALPTALVLLLLFMIARLSLVRSVGKTVYNAVAFARDSTMPLDPRA